ncbi:hypothetical protein [Pseudophaeobacter sp.]|uniref:hypothetical protein n=1 Tax=Pseudophaeobacter sp. TaxID=1971739 RepID=UPI0032972D9D
MGDKKKICGIVMPISDCDGLKAPHWLDVKSIIESAAEEAGFQARLVSDTFESNLIHKEILQNIYEDDIVVCDVSGRNPNVFFELGIRMATQKPTVIIKDSETIYPFDTAPNRYIEYPRGLRHPDMETFKTELIRALKTTAEQNKESSFIGQLGPFHIPDVESTKLPASDIILERLERIERQISTSGHNSPRRGYVRDNSGGQPIMSIEPVAPDTVDVLLHGYDRFQATEAVSELSGSQKYQKLDLEFIRSGKNEVRFQVTGRDVHSSQFAEDLLRAVEDVIPF